MEQHLTHISQWWKSKIQEFWIEIGNTCNIFIVNPIAYWPQPQFTTMSSIGTGYDLDSTTWSPQGRVFQVEYAGKAVDNSGYVFLVNCRDYVIIKFAAPVLNVDFCWLLLLLYVICSTAIALRGKDGVVFAIEYAVTSKLYEKEPHHRIFNIGQHIGMVSAGLIADGRMVCG